MNQIKNRLTNQTICEGDKTIKKLAEENRVDLKGANLQEANLQEADLQEADLQGANLKVAKLKGADLQEAKLQWVDLKGANLRWADLQEAKLQGANLQEADLQGADLEFYGYPSVRLLSSIPMTLSDELTLEAMRRNAVGHPYPERFDEWAAGGDCPYKNEEEFWRITPKREIWKPGDPQMIDRDFITRICQEMKWKIRGYKAVG